MGPADGILRILAPVTAVLFLCALLVLVLAATLLALREIGRLDLWPAVLMIETAPLEVYRTNLGPFNLSLFRLSLLIAVLTLAYRLARGRPVGRSRPPALVLYALLIAWQLVSLAAVSTNRSLGYRVWSEYAVGVIAAIVITRFASRRDLRVFAWAYLASAVLPLVASAWRIFEYHITGSANLPGLSILPVNQAILAARESGSFLIDGTQRMQGTFSDPNNFGFFVATVLIIAVALTVSELVASRRMQALWAGLIAVLCAVGVIGSYSRSAWLLDAVGVGALMLLIGRSIWTPRRVVAAVVVVLVVASAVSPVVASRVNPSNRGTQVSDQVHEHTMRIALNLLQAHPLIGVGIGSYGSKAGQPTLASNAHSTLLTVGAEEGLPGFLLLLGVMVLTSYGGVRALSRLGLSERIAVAGLPAAYLALALANMLYDIWTDDFQWMLFALVLAVSPTLLTERQWLPRLSLARVKPRLSR